MLGRRTLPTAFHACEARRHALDCDQRVELPREGELKALAASRFCGLFGCCTAVRFCSVFLGACLRDKLHLIAARVLYRCNAGRHIDPHPVVGSRVMGVRWLCRTFDGCGRRFELSMCEERRTLDKYLLLCTESSTPLGLCNTSEIYVFISRVFIDPLRGRW